jgi:predicted 3-demethylubiquinone-9 3-methyltransferase (glyoxalase superfamily)
MNKITPWLWFDGQAEQAAHFYTSIFKNSRMGDVSRFGEGGPMPAGSVMTAQFEIDGQAFVALNGGPAHKFTEAVSFYVDCESQEEVDELWEKLAAGGGEPGQCGWLKDKYGVSWQIVPREFITLMNDPDPARAGRVVQAMLKMSKLDLAVLRAAADG